MVFGLLLYLRLRAGAVLLGGRRLDCLLGRLGWIFCKWCSGIGFIRWKPGTSLACKHCLIIPSQKYDEPK